MTARNPPFRAEHVGSLLRPKYLFEKRGLYEAGKCSLEELRSAEDMAIQHVVKLQQDLGFKTITDGEMRRGMFFEGVFDNLEGMVLMPTRLYTHIAVMKDAGVTSDKTIYCSVGLLGKIKRTKPFYVDQFKYTASLVAPDDVKYIKLNVCSPSWFHQRHGSDYTYDHNVYTNDDEYFDDLGVAYRQEFQELYDLGCRTDSVRCRMMETSVDPESLLDTYIRAINVCTNGRPDDLTVSVHMCRGNFMGAHFCDGGYDPIASKVFNNLDVDTFYLEYDDERSGDFAALKYLPPNKSAVLGLVTTKRGQLESTEALKVRINDAARALLQGNHQRTMSEALNQLSISTQCGFASVWQGNLLLNRWDQYNKLKLLADTTKQVWTD
ncbi:hypothetical protein CPB85DRAFT_1372203 [Mucidula mucida]|nr:hypothetical protein CPB85DRAFT_1372203 [Mucidula mucida]